jgi:hypothetical protein
MRSPEYVIHLSEQAFFTVLSLLRGRPSVDEATSKRISKRIANIIAASYFGLRRCPEGVGPARGEDCSRLSGD